MYIHCAINLNTYTHYPPTPADSRGSASEKRLQAVGGRGPQARSVHQRRPYLATRCKKGRRENFGQTTQVMVFEPCWGVS